MDNVTIRMHGVTAPSPIFPRSQTRDLGLPQVARSWKVDLTAVTKASELLHRVAAVEEGVVVGVDLRDLGGVGDDASESLLDIGLCYGAPRERGVRGAIRL